MVGIFLKEELESFKLYQLKRLARYYNLKYNGLNKRQLIDKLFELIGVQEQDSSQEPQMSVRVRRAYESTKGK